MGIGIVHRRRQYFDHAKNARKRKTCAGTTTMLLENSARRIERVFPDKRRTASSGQAEVEAAAAAAAVVTAAAAEAEAVSGCNMVTIFKH